MVKRDVVESYRFDAFQFDQTRGMVLRKDGTELQLRPKVFALLHHLLDNPGRLLSRGELIEALWPNVAVTEDSLTQCISNLRHVLGERGDCRKIGGAEVSWIVSRLFSDQGWMRGLDVEVGEDRG